jgi:phosphatidylglycerophosphate synthase
MRSLSYLPNLLSSLRITLAPAILGAAYSNSKFGFIALLSVAMVTDVADGIFARHWNSETPMGRRLDHWGDGLTVFMGAAGIYFLWPEKIENEWTWCLAMLIGYGVIGFDRLWRRPDRVHRPHWWERVWKFVPPVALIALIAGWSPPAFRVVAVLQPLMALIQLEMGAPAAGKKHQKTPLSPLLVKRGRARG